MEIARKVGEKYGVEPGRLEAGMYPPEQMEVLTRLLKQYEGNWTEENAEAYLEQKAKFLTGK